MYVRVWFDDGAVSDRPCTIVWDGNPAAEWPAEPELRTRVASQAFHDNGTPASDREEHRFRVPSGCPSACVVFVDDGDTEWRYRIT